LVPLDDLRTKAAESVEKKSEKQERRSAPIERDAMRDCEEANEYLGAGGLDPS
jgi:hypothetical protein